MRTIVAAVIALLSLSATPLLACAPHLCAPVAAKKAVFVADRPVQLAVVAYGATYAPNTAAEITNEKFDQLLEYLKRFELRLAALEKQPPPATAPVPSVPAAPDGKLIFEARCATCHKAAVAASKGRKKVLQEDDGKLPAFSLIERKSIPRTIHAGDMPPGGAPLSAAEKTALIEFMFPKKKESNP